MMLDKKQIQAIFLLEFKMSLRCSGVQWWFKEFCKGDERLEDEELSDWPSEVDKDQLKAIIEADPLIITVEVAEELKTNHSIVENFSTWMPYQLTKKKKKNCCFEVSSSVTLDNNNEPFLHQIVACEKK
uniref:Uncharacterized protein n=1 Tax=Muntiacus muntjak TaxID=9888 RepID=A0A5N3UNB1_MUNMU|nr:hypothetical protein FD754_024769 [Muntiacus muntjak]